MIEALQTSFKHITYNDAQHRYFSNGGELLSVTKFLSSLKPRFQAEFWSIVKAYQFSGYETKTSWNNFSSFTANSDIISVYDDHSHLEVTPEDVLEQWKLDGLIGTTRGTYIHDFLENLENRITDIPKIELIPGMSIGESINYVNSLEVAKKLCQEYVEFAQDNLIMIAAEYIVGDVKLGLAGRFDRLYLNKDSGDYEIWDFKTDKQIRYKSNFGKLKGFNLPDCEIEKYSLQTSLYKKIIQDATGITLGTSRIVWFNLKENRYEIIDCKDYTNLLSNENNWRTYIQS